MFTGSEHISWGLPLLDKRLLVFCLAVPGHLKLRNGIRRYLIRAGLDGVLPSEIQWRETKEPFSVDYHLRYNRQRPQIYKMLGAIKKNDPVREIVDVEALTNMAEPDIASNRGSQSPDAFNAMHLVPGGIYLIYFLRQFDEFKIP